MHRRSFLATALAAACTSRPREQPSPPKETGSRVLVAASWSSPTRGGTETLTIYEKGLLDLRFSDGGRDAQPYPFLLHRVERGRLERIATLLASDDFDAAPRQFAHPESYSDGGLATLSDTQRSVSMWLPTMGEVPNVLEEMHERIRELATEARHRGLDAFAEETPGGALLVHELSEDVLTVFRDGMLELRGRSSALQRFAGRTHLDTIEILASALEVVALDPPRGPYRQPSEGFLHFGESVEVPFQVSGALVTILSLCEELRDHLGDV